MFIVICWLLFYYFHSCLFLSIWLVVIDEGKVDEMGYSKEAQLKFQTRGSQTQAQILRLKTQAHNPFTI